MCNSANNINLYIFITFLANVERDFVDFLFAVTGISVDCYILTTISDTVLL